MNLMNRIKGFFRKALNPKSGPFRLTLVISILISVFLGREAAFLSDASYSNWFHFLTTIFDGGITIYSSFQLSNFLSVFIGTSAIIWIIYLIIYWIAKGFANKE